MRPYGLTAVFSVCVRGRGTPARPVHGTAAGWSATLDPAKRGESSERKWAYQSYGPTQKWPNQPHRGMSA